MFRIWRKKFAGKRALILETERYHYHKVISDISGQDIENHSDDPKTLILKVRNWLSANNSGIIIPGQSEIWIAYNQFTAELTSNLIFKYSTSDIEEMPIGDYIKFAKAWIKNFVF